MRKEDDAMTETGVRGPLRQREDGGMQKGEVFEVRVTTRVLHTIQDWEMFVPVTYHIK